MFSLLVPILVWQDSIIALVPSQSSTRIYPVLLPFYLIPDLSAFNLSRSRQRLHL